MIFKPRTITGSVKALYYWKSRITGGITARFASKANGEGFVYNATGVYTDTGISGTIQNYTSYLNGYLDLGLYGEYAVDRMVSVYGRISNLLNQKYYGNTLVPVSGLYATIGLIINL